MRTTLILLSFLLLAYIMVGCGATSTPSPIEEGNDNIETLREQGEEYLEYENSNENESLEDQRNDNTNSLTLAGDNPRTYLLPPPALVGSISVEEALMSRRSHRSFQDKPLTPEQLSQILWAAYGVSSDRGFRTAPSAGALYPLEIFVVVGNVTGIEAGVYRYLPNEHKIKRTSDEDIRQDLAELAWGQSFIQDAPILVIYTAIFSRTTLRYGEEPGRTYVHMEVGHSAQNIYLQAETLGLGTCAVGAFRDNNINHLLGIPVDSQEVLLYLMPVGYISF